MDIDREDEVVMVSEHPIFKDLHGVNGVVQRVKGPASDPEFTVVFNGGHRVVGLHSEDIQLLQKNEDFLA